MRRRRFLQALVGGLAAQSLPKLPKLPTATPSPSAASESPFPQITFTVRY